MKRTFILLTAVLALSVSCEKSYIPEGLRAQATLYRLGSDAGSTPVMVYAGCSWKAELESPSEWAYIENGSGGPGLGSMTFNYSENEGVSRMLRIIISGGGLRDTVTMVQAIGIKNPEIKFGKTEVSASGMSSRMSIPFETNLAGFVELETSVDYPDPEQSGWVRDISIEDSVLYFTLGSYTGSTLVRTAYITIAASDASSDYSARFMISQSAEAYFNIVVPTVGYRGGDIEMEVDTNMGLLADAIYSSIVWDFGEDEPWAELLADLSTDSKAVFHIRKNPGYEQRSCSFTLSYTDDEGNKFSNSFTISQNKAPKPGEGSSNEEIIDDGTNTYNDNWTH